MGKRQSGSVISYGGSIALGLIGVMLCCVFGFGTFSSPTWGDLWFVVVGLLMALLIAFGFRGIREHRKLGDEIWWQLLAIGVVAFGALILLAIFFVLGLTVLSDGPHSF
jgi:drug/metabolite transporter (DMT)-like permease